MYLLNIQNQLLLKLSRSQKNKYSVELLGEQLGLDRNQIRRFIRLTYLIEPLQEMVDGRHENEIKIAFNPAVELSYLTESEQYDLANAIVENQRTPSLAQCQEFKRLSHDGELTSEFIEDTLSEEKPNQREKLSFQMKEIDKYFPQGLHTRQEEGFDDSLAGKLGKEKITRTRTVVEYATAFFLLVIVSKLLEGQFVFASGRVTVASPKPPPTYRNNLYYLPKKKKCCY